MKRPNNPAALKWSMVHLPATGAFGHLVGTMPETHVAAGWPIVEFVGCNTPRYCTWDELRMGQRPSDP